MNPRRILHISTDYKPVGQHIGHGGVERLVYWLVREQVKGGARIDVVTMEGSEFKGALEFFPSDMQAIKRSNLAAYREIQEETFARIASLAKSGQWDVIHDHMGAFATSRHVHSVPPETALVLSCYGLLDNPHYRDIYLQIPRLKASVKGMMVTVCSKSHHAHMSGVFESDRIVHHGVPEVIGEQSARESYCLYWAVVMPGKEQLRIARALRASQTHCVFAGPLATYTLEEERYAANFLREVHDLRGVLNEPPALAMRLIASALTHSPVVYVGEVTSRELTRLLFLKARKFLLCASHDEPFSLALLEAMSYGISPAAGPFPSAREAIADVGEYVDSLDPETWSQIAKTRGSPPQVVQKYCRERFGVRQWCARWGRVYEYAVARRLEADH